ncbi:MAG: HEAT repeat domain-containing protein [Acidobacteria bacterium]|nr:MAG: HEAT repeat domain-containing protein [Acidobacteriota bacterium]
MPAESLAECMRLLDRLPAMEVDAQLAALERLIRIPHPQVRRRALGLGAAILSDERLAAFLHDDADDVRRNAGLEMLKLRRRRALHLAAALLDDPDPDVALQAVLALGHRRDLRALEPLRKALRHPCPNVVQEGIVALGRLGLPQALDDLLPLIDAEPWIATAAIEAIGRLRASAAAPALVERLRHPVLGAFAAEALARIGGSRAFVALAELWLAPPPEADRDLLLRLLPHVLERLTCAPPPVAGLEQALEEHLQDADPSRRQPALQCLLILRGGERSLPSF